MKHQTIFNDLHQEEIKSSKDIIHVYAEPYFTGEDSDFESDIRDWNEVEDWFEGIKKTKKLIRKGFIEYIHPEIQNENYYDICYIEKGTFDYKNARVGQIYPAIIYTHNQTILTIATVHKHIHSDIAPREVGEKYPYLLYIYYPCAEAKRDFDNFQKNPLHEHNALAIQRYFERVDG